MRKGLNRAFEIWPVTPGCRAVEPVTVLPQFRPQSQNTVSRGRVREPLGCTKKEIRLLDFIVLFIVVAREEQHGIGGEVSGCKPTCMRRNIHTYIHRWDMDARGEEAGRNSTLRRVEYWIYSTTADDRSWELNWVRPNYVCMYLEFLPTFNTVALALVETETGSYLSPPYSPLSIIFTLTIDHREYPCPYV